MQLVQYTITLPADYDMGIIRRRVASRGQMTDDFAGLAFKTYLIRERGQHGSPVNQYAPFYLWRSDEGLARFMWGGGGFGAVVESFGRPAAEHWTLAARSGVGPFSPQWVTRQDEPLPEGSDPTGALGVLQTTPVVQPQPGALWSAVGVNIEHWQVTRFSLWAQRPELPGAALYEVLHFSQPEFAWLSGEG